MAQQNYISATSHGKKAYDQYIKNEFIDDSGRAVINVNLENDIPLYNPLSMGKQVELNEEIISYIDRKIECIDSNAPVRIAFHGREFDETEQYMIKELLKEHFSLKLFDTRNQLRENRRKYILLTILGIVMLGIYFTLDYAIGDGIKTEIISIIGSFALWEAVDLFILERREILRQLKSQLIEMSCEVVFGES